MSDTVSPVEITRPCDLGSVEAGVRRKEITDVFRGSPSAIDRNMDYIWEPYYRTCPPLCEGAVTKVTLPKPLGSFGAKILACIGYELIRERNVCANYPAGVVGDYPVLRLRPVSSIEEPSVPPSTATE